jgi:hypothetical protein
VKSCIGATAIQKAQSNTIDNQYLEIVWVSFNIVLAPILERQATMTENEIIKAISKVEGLGGMTVNERLYVCGLMDEFDKALIIDDKGKAKKILELLGVDRPSIEKIVA